MNNGERKGLIGITLVAIMIASILVMLAPAAIAKYVPRPPSKVPNSTIRIYGDCGPKGNAPERYVDWTQPFDPTVIPKDSVTFNPAILKWGPDYPMFAQSQNIDLKTYLRMWYEPEGQYLGPNKRHCYPTINLEYTYLLIDSQDKLPWHANVSSRFAFPICEIENQTGLGAFENKPGSFQLAEPLNLVHLWDVSGDLARGDQGALPDGNWSKTVNGTIAISKKYYLAYNNEVQFLDHKLKYIGTDNTGTVAVVLVSYAGNLEDDTAYVAQLPKSRTIYFDRHNSYSTAFSRNYPWFAHFEFKMQDSHWIAVDVGRYLWNCAVFYVDGVRYDVTAVEVLDNDGDAAAEKFKSITLRTKLPKCIETGKETVMDESVVTSQWIRCIPPLNETLPVLPPFNIKHSIVDDIDISLWAPLKHSEKWPKGDPNGVPGQDWFPCAEKYLTMQYPPAQWLKKFAAVPVSTIGFVDIVRQGPHATMPLPAKVPTDWELWENYGGPFYPGDDLPPYWRMDECGTVLASPDPYYSVFDTSDWIAYEVKERILDNVDPLVVYYVAETKDYRLSTDLLEKLNEAYIGTPYLYENWTKFDIQTLPDMYTEFVLPEIPDLNVTTKENQTHWITQLLHGDYLITTSLIAPNSLEERPVRGGDFPLGRVAFSYDMADGLDGIDIYVNSDLKNTSKNVTVRIYGDIDPAAPPRYTNWEQPFNPTVIRKDSITFDAAKLLWDGAKYPMSAQSENIDLKEYLRAWYEPCYNFFKVKKPTVVTETTYMLTDRQDEKPWHGSAYDTWFAFPIAENESTKQIGLELFENVEGMPATPNVVQLTLVGTKDDIPVGLYNKSVYGKIRIQKKYYLDDMYNETVQFLDHKVRFLGTEENGTIAVVEVGYAGNKDDDTWIEVHLNQSETVWFDRHNVMYRRPNHQSHPVATFYLHFEFKMQDTHWGAIDVGKELEWCDVFYVDSVRYEVVAVEVLDHNGDKYAEKFKYITLRTPFPKDVTNSTFCTQRIDDGGWVASSQWITMIPPCHPIPVLPPMNMEHKIVDDTDVVLWQPLKHLDKWPRGDKNGVPGSEWFPCAERFLTMQYPPYPWLKFFRAVPIDTDKDMKPRMPTDWEVWENYGGPFYPGTEMPEYWRVSQCGVVMYPPEEWTIFDNEHWIANDVDERLIGPIPPLEFCWKEETKEPRYSTNLLEILYENVTGIGPIVEGWTKYDIQTLPDIYTAFKLPVIPSLKPVVYVGGDTQDYFKPDIREYPGSYLITTSFFAPNAEGDLNLNQTYVQGNRYAFTFNASEGIGIYMNEDPVIEPTECGWTFKLKQGLNYVSFVAIPANPSPTAIFGPGVTVLAYDPVGGWYAPAAVECGTGYYVYTPVAKDVTVHGSNCAGMTWDTIVGAISPGWNLVGPGDTEITIGDSSYIIVGYDTVSDTFVTLYKGNTLQRGQGYWILKTP